MATSLTSFIPVSELPDHSRESNSSLPISEEDLFLVSENSTDSDTHYESKRMTYKTLHKSLSVDLEIGSWVPKKWVMGDRWIYGNNVSCDPIMFPQGPEYNPGNPMYLWGLQQTLSTNIVSVLSHPLSSAMTDVFHRHKFKEICAFFGNFDALCSETIEVGVLCSESAYIHELSVDHIYLSGEELNPFQFKGKGLLLSPTEISDITPENDTYQQIVLAKNHSGWVYEITKVDEVDNELSNLEYASNGNIWVQLGFNLPYTSKTQWGIAKVADGGIDVSNGIINTEDHIVCSKAWYEGQIKTGAVKDDTIYYLSDDTCGDTEASPTQVGGIRLGYTTNYNNFALLTDLCARAYTTVPYANASQAGVMKPGTGLQVDTIGTVSLKATSVSPGNYGLNGSVSPAAGGSFTVPFFTVDGTGRLTNAANYTVTVPDGTSYWNSVVRGSIWSRICRIVSNDMAFSSLNFMFAFRGTDGTNQYDSVYAVAVYGQGQSGVTKIAGTGNIYIRITSNASSECYVELYNANLGSAYSHSLQCAIVKISDIAVDKYTSFTDGTTVPSGYSVGAQLSQIGYDTVTSKFYADNLATANLTANGGIIANGSISANNSVWINNIGTLSKVTMKFYLNNNLSNNPVIYDMVIAT